MKKTILVTLVAALMLFAFTACQDPIDVNGYVPSDLSISYNGNGVLVGQSFDPADFSGTITYKNGKTAPYTGTFTLGQNATTYSEGNNTVSAMIASGTGSTAAVVSATCNVVGYAPSALELGNLPTTVEQNGILNLAGSTLTVTYGEGQTTTLSYDDGEFTVGATVTATGAVGSEADVTLSGVYLFGKGSNYSSLIKGLDWSVEIVNPSVELAAKDMTTITATVVNKADNPVIVGEGGGAVEVQVTGSDGSKTRVLDPSEYTIENGLSSIVFTEAKTYTFQVRLNDKPSVVDELAVVVSDTLTNVSVLQKSTVKITAGTAKTLTGSDFDIKGIKASDGKTEVTTGFTNVVITPSYIAAHEAAGTRYVTVSFTYAGQTFTVENVEVTVEAAAVAGTGSL